jgi:hypothetical protein
MSSFIGDFSDTNNFEIIDGIIYIVDNGDSYKSKLRNNMELDRACQEELEIYSTAVDNDDQKLTNPIYATLDYTTEEFDEDIYLSQNIKNYNSTTIIKPKSQKKHNKRNKKNMLKIGNSIKTIESNDLLPEEWYHEVFQENYYDINDCFDEDNYCYCGHCTYCSDDDDSYYSYNSDNSGWSYWHYQ